MLLMGGLSFRIKYSAEKLQEDINRTSLSLRHDIDALGRTLTEFIEKGAYLNPDISVFVLATHFHVSQDQVVDALYRLHGVHFSNYVDSLRVNHAVELLTEQGLFDDTDNYDRLAHQCGYLSGEALEHAFQKEMHSSIRQFISRIEN